MGEYEFSNRVKGRFRLPKFKINFSFQFGIEMGSWFKNRMLPGPDCEEELGAKAAAAAYNRL